MFINAKYNTNTKDKNNDNINDNGPNDLNKILDFTGVDFDPFVIAKTKILIYLLKHSTINVVFEVG